MSKFLPANFNDFLAVILIVGIIILWIAQACTKLALPAEVTGALIVTWTLIVQYYFRKKQEEK
jgi:hypothetical protein